MKVRRSRRPTLQWKASPWTGYAQAIGLVVIVVLMHAAPNLPLESRRLTWILVLAVVSACAAWACGPGPGLAATILALLYSVWWLVLPLHWNLASVERVIALSLLLLVGICAVLASAAH
jgi:hypothetical protein